MIRTLLSAALTRLAGWLAPLPARPLATSFPSLLGRPRPPAAHELLAELKNTAWTCASLNAAVCASFPPRLYVRTRAGQPSPRCLTRALSRKEEQRLRPRGGDRIEEVTEHPLLDLLAQVNAVHNALEM